MTVNGRSRRSSLLKGLLPFLLLFLVCERAAAQELPAVEGRVVTQQGEPLPTRVNLRLETQDGLVVVDQPTDSRGVFRFPDLQRGLYRLTATAEGFQTTQQMLDLRRGAARFLITVTMVPSDPTKPGPSNPVSATDLIASKKARKAYEKGKRAFQKGELEEARAHFEKAVSEYPCFARAQTDLGVVLGLLAEFHSAEAAIRKALECDGGFLEAYIQLGLLLNLQKKFSESESVLQAGLGHFPSAWQLHYQRAAAAYGLGRYAEAMQHYLRAQSLNEAVPKEIHVRLADIYVQQKEYGKAYAELGAYLRAEPEGRFAKKVAEVMTRMEREGVLHASQAASRSTDPATREEAHRAPDSD